MPEAESNPESKPIPRLGSYRLTDALGSGGMSSVYRAIHEETGNTVAVKVLPRSLAKNPVLLQRFLREAISAEALDHPNIAAIYDRGFDQGRHYLVLEYVAGGDLHDQVRKHGPMEPLETIRVIREVCEGLRYASAQGMIHRDVKPANLLMGPDGHAKIIDLGLALQLEDEDERVTRDGTTVGTVDYMAPEQARDSRKTSERSDIYSLGCTIYYLLTGSPPYPGGNVAEKLAKHHSAPIPDVRAKRPELSEELSLLVRRMMEKKPERRYENYDQLIAALDELTAPKDRPPTAVTGVLDALVVEDDTDEEQPAEPLEALIVDDDDDDDPIGLAPTEPALGGGREGRGLRVAGPAPSSPAVDLAGDSAARSGTGKHRRPAGSPVTREPAVPAEVSLADLADLVDDEPVPTPSRRPRSSATVPSPAVRPGSHHAMDLDEAYAIEGAGPPTYRRGSGGEVPLQTWIAAGVLVGFAVAFVGVGVALLISSSRSKDAEASLVRKPAEEEAESSAIKGLEARPGPTAPTTARPATTAPRPAPKPKAATKGDRLAKVETPAPRVEEPPAVEVAYSREVEARFLPAAMDPLPAMGSKIVVRRLLEAGDLAQTASLATAFGRPGDLVEFADAGPYFEDDCQLRGKARLVRGRPGIRPMIKVESTSQSVIKDQEAKFVLGGGNLEQLVIEGVDLVVDLRDLPPRQSSLFLARGAELTLRDCTITLVNGDDRGNFSLIRLEEGLRANRVRLERTLIRGPIRTLVDLTAARAQIELDRSVVLSESGAVVVAESVEKASRSLSLYRSVIASRGPLVEWTTRAGSVAWDPRWRALTVHALGSSFVRVDGGVPTALFHSRATVPGGATGPLDWHGEDNTFVGWPAWFSSGTGNTVTVAGLDEARSTWKDTDSSSTEAATPWPPAALRDDLEANNLAASLPRRKATLATVARPHPFLRELTVGNLAKLPTPEIAANPLPFVPPAVAKDEPQPELRSRPDPRTRLEPRTGPEPKTRPEPKARPIVPLDLQLDLATAPYQGDLGRFLAEKVTEPRTRTTVHVRGTGVHPFSPVRLPDGASVVILVEPSFGARTAPPSWAPTPEAAGVPLIELRRGDLSLTGLSFVEEGPNRPRHWIKVEDSLLAIRSCRFRDGASADARIGAAIAFEATGVTPLTPRSGAFTTYVNRPTLRIRDAIVWTGGEALRLDVGRGAVDLENCLIISGGPAATLNPSKVPRDRFEADLILERCTIATDRTAIQLGAWPGDPAGPVRPWLLATRQCVFPRVQRDATGALLVVDPEAFARGTLFWQAVGDFYEIARFVAGAGPAPGGAPVSADVKRQWVDLWGPNHVRGVRGPDPRQNRNLILPYKDKERPKPGKVTPGSLELEAKAGKDLGVNFPALPRG
jgi:serine/threonine-protein kinase